MAAGWARSRFQSVSVVPTIQWLRHGMTNSTDFSVRRIIPVSDGILSRATRKCTPFDALTRNRPRVPAACCIWSVHTPVQLTTTDGADVGLAAGLDVAHADAGDPVDLVEELDDLGGGADHRAVLGGGAPHHHRVAGVVGLGVEVADRPDQRAALERRRHPQRPGPGQLLLVRQRALAADRVVERDAGRDVRALPVLGQRVQEADRLDQVRGEAGQAELALPQRLAHQPEVQLLQVAQPAVEELRRPARRARREVTGLDEGHLQPAGRGVERRPGADHAAADHDDVELLGGEPVPRPRPVPRPQAGGLRRRVQLLGRARTSRRPGPSRVHSAVLRASSSAHVRPLSADHCLRGGTGPGRTASTTRGSRRPRGRSRVPR